MLIQENIDQIFDECEVWERDPEATAQTLNRVVFKIAQRRSYLLGVEPRLIDGFFAAWAICLPLFPQPRSYTELMQERRREWFEGVSTELLDRRATGFFTDSLLRLDLHELASLVAVHDAVERVAGYLGELGEIEASDEAEQTH